MKFLYPEVNLYLYCINLPYGLTWNTFVMSGTPSCYFRMLDKLQKKMSKTVDVHLNWVNWFQFLILVAGSHVILIGCMIFLSPF